VNNSAANLMSLGDQVRLPNAAVDFGLDFVETSLQLRLAGRYVRQHFGKTRTVEAGVSPREENGDAEAEPGDPVSMSFGNPLDHPVQTKASEVVRHFALRNVMGLLPGEDCELCPQIPIGKTTRQQAEPDQQMPERQHAEVGDAQGRGSLPIYLHGPI